MPFKWRPIKPSDTVSSELDKMAKGLIEGGAKAISYHLAPPFFSQVSKGASAFHFGYSDDLVSRYLAPELFENDPIPDFVMSAGHVMTWRQAIAEQKLSQDQTNFYKTFEELGLIDGVAVPLFGPNGMNSYLSLNFEKYLSADDEAIVRPLVGMAASYHRRICAIRNRKRVLPDPLSNREQEVLYWISRGKSNYDIGIILGISDATVGTYVRRTFKKLEVNDRMSAILTFLTYSTLKI